MKRSLATVSRAPEGAPDPHWYKDAIIYEVRVRSFFDSDGDGIGDLRGLASRLDYLQDLGVTALWMLPFYPSPLRDDGYDIADYTGIHPEVGTLADFDHLLSEAHRRGLRVITELVLNHTSDQHPWFQRARRAPAGSVERDFYVWSDTPERYKEARIIFKDFELSNWTWDPVAKAYFWHRFYSHQPDLNFESPAVQEALFKVVDFWFARGVDGLRLDAVPYLYEQEGTSCENLPRTHEFIRELRRHVDHRFEARMLLAEANQWPEDAAAYIGAGDECHMNFHFPIMPRMYMAMHMEDRFPILDILAQTPQLPDPGQWALFLRNHDELTLEMVTDEERDYMYRAYAQEPPMRINLGIRRRLAPLCNNDRRKMELLNGLLFSLPGTPVLYYGDEIGMGDNVFLGDRNGVRTPMQWSADRNAGFSRANPQRLILPIVIDPEYHFESINVEAQQDNPASLLWWTKRLVALRKQHQAFGRGGIEFLTPANHRVLAFTRQWNDELILVVANLSRFAQHVELDLAKWRGLRPRELFGHTQFPPIGELPYLLTLGGHGFYWFALERTAEGRAELRALTYDPPLFECDSPASLLEGEDRPRLEQALPAFVRTRRWMNTRDRRLVSVALRDVVPVGEVRMLILEAVFDQGVPERYVLPVTIISDGRYLPKAAIIAQARTAAGDAALVEALEESRSAHALLQEILKAGGAGAPVRLVQPSAAAPGEALPEAEPRNVGPAHASAAIQYGDRYLLKVFRRLEGGVSPELEVPAHIARQNPSLVPAPVAVVEHRPSGRGEPITLAVLQTFVPNEGTAWTQACEEVRRYFERVLTSARGTAPPPLPELPLPSSPPGVPAPVAQLMGNYLDAAARLGRRTAQMHFALAAPTDDPAFAAEPYTQLDVRSKYQTLRNLVGKATRLLGQRTGLPAELAESARRVLESEARILRSFEAFLRQRLDAQRIRIHGDYHLEQVLNTGKDYVIIDFQGGRDRSLAERRRKRSPLRDVAGMIRSFHSAAFGVLYDAQVIRREDRPGLMPWATHWHAWASATFLAAYLERTGDAAFIPSEPQRATLLQHLVVEAAFRDLLRDLEAEQDLSVALHALIETLRL
jgi:maltose alpha-D-glucosyltransferase / alpha-amylase